MVLGAGLRHQSLRWPWYESNTWHFVGIAIQSIISFILNTCKRYLLLSFMLFTTKDTGRMAESSKALVYGIFLFDRVGSSPTPFILLAFLYKVMFPFFWTPAHGILYHHPSYWPNNIQMGWASGLRRWFKAPVTSVARVWVSLLSFCWHSYI